MLTSYNWADLSQQSLQEQLERRSACILNERLQKIGLKVNGLYLVHSALPSGLQKALLQAEQNCIEATNRAKILQKYSEILGDRLAEMMPYIIQWEYANLLHKNGHAHLLLTPATLPLAGPSFERDIAQSVLPLHQPLERSESEASPPQLHGRGNPANDSRAV
jgi:hypothetical protein